METDILGPVSYNSSSCAGQYTPGLDASILIGQQPLSQLSDTSSDASSQPHKEKFEHLKITVQQLQRELQSEKIKNKGQDTIAKSLAESKSENVSLRRELKNKNSAIAVLQNRLAQCGQSTQVTLEEGEVVIPGPSRQMLDTLSQENVKLKQSLRYMSVDPSQVEKLQKDKQLLERQFTETSRQVQRVEEENKELVRALQSSDNMKDREMMSLKQRVKELEQSKQCQSLLCESLCEEAETLRHRLNDSVQQCETLERRMSTLSVSPSTGFTTTAVRPPPLRQTVSSDFQTMDSATQDAQRIAAYKEENLKLNTDLVRKSKELQEVVEMNSRWQKYNEQREEYVKKLQRTLHDTDDKLSQVSGATDGISEEQQARIDQIILQCKRKVEVAEEEKQKVEDENRELHLQQHELEKQLKQAAQEMLTLRQQVQALSNQDHSLSQSSLSDRERVQLLEHQIKICTDDFEQERKDREQAMSRIATLENELDFHRRQLQQFQQVRMEEIAQRRRDSLNRYQNQYYQHNSHMVARGNQQQALEVDGDEEDENGEDVIDGRMKSVTPGNRPSTAVSKAQSDSPLQYATGSGQIKVIGDSDDSPRPNLSSASEPRTSQENLFSQPHDADFGEKRSKEDTIHCPKCHLGFPSDKHFDLLDHINDCC